MRVQYKYIFLLFIMSFAACKPTGPTDIDHRQWYSSLSPEWRKPLKEAIYLLDAPSDDDLIKMLTLPKLDISGKRGIITLEPLRPITTLVWLNAAQTGINSIEPISGATNMVKLNLDYTLVSDLSPIKQMPKLQMLWCSAGSVSDLSALSGLQNFYTLNIAYTQVRSLEPLRNCPKLSALTMSDTNIDNLEPIMNLSEMRYLDCRRSKVSEAQIAEFRQKHPMCEIKSGDK